MSFLSLSRTQKTVGPKILEIWDTLLHSDYSIKIYTPYSSFLCSLMVLRSSPPVSIFYTSEEKSGLTKILCGFPYANFSLSKLFVNVQQDIMLQLYINNTYVRHQWCPPLQSSLHYTHYFHFPDCCCLEIQKQKKPTTL